MKKYLMVMLGTLVLLGAQAHADPEYPRASYRWYMSDFNDSEGAFTEEAGLELEAEVIEYRNGAEDTVVRKLNGLNKYGDIHMKPSVDKRTNERTYLRWQR